MSQQGVTAASWKHEPMSSERARIRYLDKFTPREMDTIRLGYVPEEMEEKWFIYMEGDWLYLHQSWTGDCTFMVKFYQGTYHYRIAEAWATRDGIERGTLKRKDDAREIRFLIRFLLLHEDIEYPRREGEWDYESAMRMWGCVGKEMVKDRKRE